ncbi:hypothetical protein CC2G_005622 [Coprinopsis cinerea AmutBmut pab1-1]|nr:hypothetical protein CC2G_005622 [Coprinopsis cinerea AmutBmut pab1-1]
MSEKAPPPYPEPALALAPISESIHAPAPAPVPHSSGYAVQAPEAHPQPRAAPAPAANLGAQYQQDRLAQCAVGNHDTTTKYGACGIIFAIVRVRSMHSYLPPANQPCRPKALLPNRPCWIMVRP